MTVHLHGDPSADAGVYLAGQSVGVVAREVRPKADGKQFEAFTVYRLAVFVGQDVLQVEYKEKGWADAAHERLEAGGHIPVQPYGGKDGRIYYRSRLDRA